jgi:hypothetical protein
VYTSCALFRLERPRDAFSWSAESTSKGIQKNLDIQKECMSAEWILEAHRKEAKGDLVGCGKLLAEAVLLREKHVLFRKNEEHVIDALVANGNNFHAKVMVSWLMLTARRFDMGAKGFRLAS